MENREIIYNNEYPRFEINYEFKEAYLKCEVYEINSWFQDKSYDSKDIYLKGYVKWDGCSHFNFGNDDGYLHLCGKSYIDEMDKVLQTVWRLASETILNFDPC